MGGSVCFSSMDPVSEEREIKFWAEEDCSKKITVREDSILKNCCRAKRKDKVLFSQVVCQAKRERNWYILSKNL